MGIRTWVSFEPVTNEKNFFVGLHYLTPVADRIKIGKLNYFPSDIDWGDFGRNAEELCKSLGVEYYIKDNLKQDMEKLNIKLKPKKIYKDIHGKEIKTGDIVSCVMEISDRYSRAVEGIIVYDSFVDDYCIRTNGYNYPLGAMLPSNRVEITGRNDSEKNGSKTS